MSATSPDDAAMTQTGNDGRTKCERDAPTNQASGRQGPTQGFYPPPQYRSSQTTEPANEEARRLTRRRAPYRSNAMLRDPFLRRCKSGRSLPDSVSRSAREPNRRPERATVVVARHPGPLARRVFAGLAVAMSDYDLVVIGSGPAGEGAAMQASKAGKRVALVERHPVVGGGCTHWGTIPSKALRHTAGRMLEIRKDPLLAGVSEALRPEFPKLIRTADDVIKKQVTLRQGFYTRNSVHVVHGNARFASPNELLVAQTSGTVERITSQAFVIATGSRPYRPPDVDFSHPRVRDSDTILDLDRSPRSIAIYGAGVIGCEYACIFRNFDIKVDLINQRNKLLSFLDDEIIDALSYHLRDQGIILRHDEEYERIEPRDDGVILHLKSGKKVRSDYLLWANGRTGNSQNLGLEEIGITPDHRGHIQVDENYRTALEHIYAAGDVIGPPGLASASYDQGRAVARHWVTGTSTPRSELSAPAGIYTAPEISCIGRTERELTEERVPYEVGRAQFRSLARAQITGQTVGMLKLLFHRESLEILGIHCFGDQASEIIHIGQAVMNGGTNSLAYFVDTTFNYPTMAEAYRVAALNGMNRLF